MCNSLDQKVHDDSHAAAGDNYATVTTLATRQAFGGVQLIGTTDNYYVFLKEISSDGNVNSADVVFPTMPIFLYFNPDLLRRTLQPLVEFQEGGLYPHSYAMHDMGTHYPNATGHPAGDDEYMPLEECGDMIIAMLAYANAANDHGYLSQHYKLLSQWAGYLRDEALLPAGQKSTDDFAGSLA